MATSPATPLTRQLRRGVVPSRPMPAVMHEMGGHVDIAAPVADPVGEGHDVSELDRLFSQIAASPAPSMFQPDAQPAQVEKDLLQSDFPLSKESAVTTSHDTHTQQAGPKPTTSTSRAARFGAGLMGEGRDSGNAPAAAPSQPAQDPVQPASAATAGPVAQEPSRRWSRVTDESSRVDVINAKRGMAAAKVLAPLVAAISFAPGSGSDPSIRGKALGPLVASVHRNAVDTAEALSRAFNQDVPSWMVTQLMHVYAQAFARQWQDHGSANSQALGAFMGELLTENSKEMASLITCAAEDAYVEVTGPDVARYRVAVSVTSAAWGLHEWVTHERLSVNDQGEMPSAFFTYGLPVSEIVNKMLVRCVDECRASVIQVESADLRVSHMQAAIGRMSQLMGAEYVTQTRSLMNWIGDESISQEEYVQRLEQSGSLLETQILPGVFEWARTNFLSIEQGAFSAIEQLDRAHTERSGGTAAAPGRGETPGPGGR